MRSPVYGDTLLLSMSLFAASISVLRMTSVASITISFQDLKASAANGGALIAQTLIYEGFCGGRTMLAGKNESHI